MVKTARGTNPTYTIEETNDELSQVRVCFWLPLDKVGKNFEEVSREGPRCGSICAAKSRAAVYALQEFECRPFNSKIMDVSWIQCEEMKVECKQMIIKLGEMKYGTKTLLAEWSCTMKEIEACYVSFYGNAIDDIFLTTDNICREIWDDVIDWLLVLNSTTYVKYKEMLVCSKKLEVTVKEDYALIENYLHDELIPRPDKYRGEFPSKIYIKMKYVFTEMVNALGSGNPIFEIIFAQNGLYVCQIDFTPKNTNDNADVATKSIKGSEAYSESDAMENASKAAILFLETDMSIRLLDVNYNKRSHAEVHVAKVKKLLELASAMGSIILSEWEATVSGLEAIDQYCRKMTADHPEKGPSNRVFNVKSDCAESVARLYASCKFALLLEKGRHEANTTWLDTQ